MTARPVTLRPGVPATPGERVRLAGEVLTTYVRARRRVRRDDLPTALAELRARREQPELNGREAHTAGVRLSGAALRTLRLIPADSRCLMRSLVLTGLLARRGIDSKLIVAVKPGSDFAAHAWVELDGRPLLDPAGPPFERLTEL